MEKRKIIANKNKKKVHECYLPNILFTNEFHAFIDAICVYLFRKKRKGQSML